MRMLKMKYILFAAFLLSAAGVSAQKAERDYIRKGNRLFNDSVFVDAEVNYRKALEVNPKSAVSMYNLGNTLSQQQKGISQIIHGYRRLGISFQGLPVVHLCINKYAIIKQTVSLTDIVAFCFLSRYTSCC